MQKGSIHMEPITIKARLNQAYHFSGAAGNGIRFSDLSDGPAFIFREDTSAVHNRFVPAGGCISYASPVRLTRDALPYLLFLYVESGSGTLTNAGDAAQKPESCQLAPGDLMLLPVFHDAYPFLLPLFLSVDRVFFGISSVSVCGRQHFSYEPDRGG